MEPHIDAGGHVLDARHDLELDIESHATLPPGVTPSAALSAVMCAISDRLSGGEVHDSLQSLPYRLRELLDRCTWHRGEAGIVFGRDGLVDRVAEHLAVDDADAMPVIRAVLRAIKRVLPYRDLYDVESQLPDDLRALWQSS